MEKQRRNVSGRITRPRRNGSNKKDSLWNLSSAEERVWTDGRSQPPPQDICGTLRGGYAKLLLCFLEVQRAMRLVVACVAPLLPGLIRTTTVGFYMKFKVFPRPVGKLSRYPYCLH